MTESARLVATAWMTAVTTSNVEAAIRLSSPSIVYTAGQARRYEGHEGVREIVEDLDRLGGFLIVSILDFVEKPGMVALQRLEKYTLPAGGVEIPACSFVEVEDGVVTRWADYKNLTTLDDVTG